MLELYNILIHIAHLLVVVINTLGWMVPSLRFITLLVQGITILCWAGFGLWKGWWGYCPLTDWHWQVKSAMGETDLPRDYISYIAVNWFDLFPSPELVTGLIAGSFLIALIANIYLIIKSRIDSTYGLLPR